MYACGVLERIPDPSLRRQIDHGIKAVTGKQFLHGIPVRQRFPHEAEAGQRLKQPQAVLFETDIVIIIQVIQTGYQIAPLQQALHQMKPDKSGRAGNKYPAHYSPPPIPHLPVPGLFMRFHLKSCRKRQSQEGGRIVTVRFDPVAGAVVNMQLPGEHRPGIQVEICIPAGLT